MEFLPPDVAPLHDPLQSDCDPVICLDPRRAAEDACLVAINELSNDKQTPLPWMYLWRDIEVGLGNPDKQLPDIAQRLLGIDTGSQGSPQWFQAHVLRATAPLFTYKANHEQVPDSVANEAVLALAGVARNILSNPKIKSNQVLRARAKGQLAELSVHSLLLQRGSSIPLMTSPREECSKRGRFNNDLAAFGNHGVLPKIPVQVKASGISGVRQKDRVVHVGVKRFLEQSHFDVASLADKYKEDRDPVIVISKLLASEAGQGRSPRTPESRLLGRLSKSLTERIDAQQSTFAEDVQKESVRKFVNKVIGGARGHAMTAQLRSSEHIQLDDGRYVFFNHVTAERFKDTDQHLEYSVTFGVKDRALGSISCQRLVNKEAYTLVQKSSEKYPHDVAQQLLDHLARTALELEWQPA